MKKNVRALISILLVLSAVIAVSGVVFIIPTGNFVSDKITKDVPMRAEWFMKDTRRIGCPNFSYIKGNELSFWDRAVFSKILSSCIPVERDVCADSMGLGYPSGSPLIHKNDVVSFSYYPNGEEKPDDYVKVYFYPSKIPPLYLAVSETPSDSGGVTHDFFITFFNISAVQQKYYEKGADLRKNIK